MMKRLQEVDADDTMTEQVENTEKFPKAFWTANFMELLERAAFYGFYIAITLYLTDRVGFTDKETGYVAGAFVAFLYFLPQTRTAPISIISSFKAESPVVSRSKTIKVLSVVRCAG